MPITLQVAQHGARPWIEPKVADSAKLLELAARGHHRRCKKLIQTSFGRREFHEGHVSGSRNGFVWTVYEAYCRHHHLVLRPEDIWFAILTQLSFYINAHAEELRSFFVSHQGQEHLLLEVNEIDFAHIAQEMTQLISKKVIDPELRGWVMPSFSTTTDNDKVVGSILFMGAMQKYFSYGGTLGCGLPSVTLLGEVDDWKDILARIDKIELLGRKPTQFARMLRPILNGIIKSFQSPESREVVEFWNKIAHRDSMGSGSDYLSGWLAAFCFWEEDGNSNSLSFQNLLFGEVLFPYVSLDSIPAGYASVPIEVNDDGHVYKATMVAGSVGTSATSSAAGQGLQIDSSNDPAASGQTPGHYGIEAQWQAPASLTRDTVQPVSGWWVYENKGGGGIGANKAMGKKVVDTHDNKTTVEKHTTLEKHATLKEKQAYTNPIAT
ncbi:hypothetical protein B0I35DRAFT_447035 [Stachybotrys elegans]|uniref:DUF4419 domain-containing protein n=1 Tax=Stachybotrys elegans TaxID=80388 RepID=A0A8K0WJA4_9HYPO|nr:hypothetical protein B0I35DRAFT_447035 [Stachybotrys elegans]